jgi:hypothetical protein
MQITVCGKSTDRFNVLDNIRHPYFVDCVHLNDNIDDLNKYVCEITGLYYALKSKEDIIGLEHYRRTFLNEKQQPLNEIEIKYILQNHDCIVPNLENVKYTNEHADSIYNYLLTKNVKLILDDFIKYFKEQDSVNGANFEDYIKLNHKKYSFNMFIAHKNILQKYAPLMNIALNYTKTLGDKKELSRSVGFIFENIFSYFITSMKLKLYETDILFNLNGQYLLNFYPLAKNFND